MKIKLPHTTPSCLRTLRRLSLPFESKEIQPAHLVAALLAEESLGGRILQQLGLKETTVTLAGGVGELHKSELRDDPDPCDNRQRPIVEFCGGEWLEPLLERAALLSRRTDAAGAVTTQLLVRAMSQVPGPGRRYLAAHNVLEEDMERLLDDEQIVVAETLSVDFSLDEFDAEDSKPVPRDSQARLLAAIDANLNRAREGLRVLDDCARFILRDSNAMESAKRMRHELVSAEKALRCSQPFVDSRDVEQDPGTSVTLASEESRDGLPALIQSNARRVQEALRSLEEFGKLVDVAFSANAKQLRYQAYSLEQSLLSAQESGRARLQLSQLYVLLTESLCCLPWKTVVKEVIDGGADIIQLREKHLTDEAFVQRALWISAACREAGTLFIVNDRISLVHQCHADGLHIGQEDGSVETARQVVGPERLIGLSTHNGDQLAQANRSSVDYVGAGPVFRSETKQFEDFAGIQYAKQAAQESRTPAFAIGGISQQRLPQLLEVNVNRIAVCGAIIGTDQPGAAAAEFSQVLATANRG